MIMVGDSVSKKTTQVLALKLDRKYDNWRQKHLLSSAAKFLVSTAMLLFVVFKRYSIISVWYVYQTFAPVFWRQFLLLISLSRWCDIGLSNTFEWLTDSSRQGTCMKWLMFSRSDKISERFLVPSTVRSVVWASNLVDLAASSTFTTDIVAFDTR